MNSVIEAPASTAALDNQIMRLREQMKNLNADRMALLPRLTTEERALIIESEHAVGHTVPPRRAKTGCGTARRPAKATSSRLPAPIPASCARRRKRRKASWRPTP